MIFNKRKRWSHPPRVKLLLVNMSVSWFLVSMYLIWILGSRLIRSNNQSRATLWVLETCLTVGLLPLMIILITASLSSNTYNKASGFENWTFEGTQSMLFNTLVIPWDLWFLSVTTGFPGLSEVWIVFPRTETLCGTVMANVKQTQKMILFITFEISLAQHVYELVFWCQYLWFRFWSPNWFCEINQSCATLCVRIPVSSLHFCHWWSSLSQLRCLRKCTTGTRLEKNLRLWWRSPHATITNISVFLLFGFGFVIPRTVSCCWIGWWFGPVRWT